MDKYQIINRQISLEDLVDYKADCNVLPLIEDEATRIAIALENISYLIQNKEQQSEDALLDSIKELIQSYATQDPNKVHHDNVRTELHRIKETLLSDSNARSHNLLNALHSSSTIDQLSRALVDFCKALDLKLAKVNCVEIDGMFSWDKIFLDQIGKYGQEGKKVKNFLTHGCRNLFQDFKKNRSYSYKTWVNNSNSSDQPLHVSRFLKIFVSVIWEERIKSRVAFAINNPPGTTTNVTHSIGKICNPANKLKYSKEEIQLHDKKDAILGSGRLPTGSTQKLITKDGKNVLSTLTAIRLLRYFIREVYHKFIAGNPRSFDLEFPGRARQIAECLGLKSNDHISTINTIITVLDRIKFSLPGITSSLIAVADCMPNSRYSSKGGWIITILPPLRPYYVYCEKKGTFITPLLNEPLLIGHRKYHAAQYLLQWFVTIEFSKQSVTLAQNDWITITRQDWLGWFLELEIPAKSFEKIHAAVVGPGGYLEYRGHNCYSLKNEEKSLKFLKDQGHKKMYGSIRGKTSAKKKNRTLQKIST